MHPLAPPACSVRTVVCVGFALKRGESKLRLEAKQLQVGSTGIPYIQVQLPGRCEMTLMRGASGPGVGAHITVVS
jgi:hypothetical protein